MALQIHEPTQPRLSEQTLAAWHDVPTTIISDELNRFNAMASAIAPVAPGSAFVGEALTVRVIAGDNAALHYAVARAWPGAAIIVDAGGYTDTAVWGGILHRAATRQGVVAVVIDGSVRDVAELRASTVPAYCRGAVPAGPHKGWGGTVNGLIQCGGCPVTPGDLVRGDDDGVVVVPRPLLDDLLPRCRDRMAMEARIEAAIDGGESTVTLLKLPEPGAF